MNAERLRLRERIAEAKLSQIRGRRLTTWLFYWALCERLPPRRVDREE